MADIPELPEFPTTLDYLKRVLALLENQQDRDLGIIVGVPAEDYGEYRPLPKQMLVLFSDDHTKSKKTASIAIPNPKDNITPAELKTLGTQLVAGRWWYRKGPYRGTVEFEDRRKCVVFADTEANAESLARKCAAFSKSAILRVYITSYKQAPADRMPIPRLVTPVVAYLYERSNLSDGNHADEKLDLKTL